MPTPDRDPDRDVVSAGAVVFRPGRQVLLVHRPKYDDWSFPKGKLDRGEHVTAAAVREVAEETGLRVGLGPRLASQRYPIIRRSGTPGMKTVHYWSGRVIGSSDVDGYRPNEEIDQVAWLGYEEALDLLTYHYDEETLAEAFARRKRTRAVVVLRHADSRSRRTWRGDDRKRPLLATGRRQALALAPLLQAYGVARIVTSTSTRCVETVQPYATQARIRVERRSALSEEDATSSKVAAGVAGILEALKERGPTVVCTHGPVLPEVFDALGVPPADLAKSELVVVHLRRGEVVATERHRLG